MSGKIGQNNSNKVIGKVFFVRHGDAENPEGIQGDKLLDIAKLSVIGQDQSRKIGEELYNLLYFSPNNKIRVIYDQNTDRTRESLNYILEVFKEKGKMDFLTIEGTSNLPSMEKDFQGPDYIDNTKALHNARKNEVRTETSQLLNSLLEEINDQEQIVLIGHKSNKESIIKNAIPNSNATMNAKHDEIIDLNIVPSQIKGREGEKDYEINYYDSEINELFLSNPNHLYITWQNFDGIRKSLNEELFLTWFQQFSNKEISMIDLEREINGYFKNQEKIDNNIYTQFFAFPEMRIFCLANMLKLKQLEEIKNLYNQIGIVISNQEKQIMEKYNSTFAHYMNDNNSKVQETRGKSLDLYIQKGGEPIDFRFDDEKFNNLANFFDGDNKITYIEANAGAGKSLLFAKLNEFLLKNNFKINGQEIYPIYVNLAGKTIEEVPYGTLIENKKVAYLYDSLDESYIKDSERFLQIIREKNQLSFLSSRAGYLPENSEKTEDIDVKKIKIQQFSHGDIEKFIDNCLGKENYQYNRFLNLQKKGYFKGIEKNPLILGMICDILPIIKNFENLSLEKIYEMVVDKKLKYEQATKGYKRQDINNSDIESQEEYQESQIQNRKDFLAEIAYDNIVKGQLLNQKYIIGLKRKYELRGIDEESINLIFKKSYNSQEYEFIHKSFKEFFLLRYIEKNPEKDFADISQYLFFLSCIWSKVKVLNIILNKYKINTKEKAKDGNTGFMLACRLGNKEVIEYLIDKVDIDQKDNGGMTGFMLACSGGNKEVIEYLIDKVDIDQKDNGGMTGFMNACLLGEKEIVEYLIDKVDINQKDNDGTTGFMYACLSGEKEVVEYLIDKVDINHRDDNGMTAFTHSILSGNKDVMNLIKQKNPFSLF